MEETIALLLCWPWRGVRAKSRSALQSGKPALADGFKALFNIVRQLEPNFHKNSNARVRIWNSVKGTLKKNRIKECRDSLQETKITLLLAMMPRGFVALGK